MCLSLVGRVRSVEGPDAVLEIEGHDRRVSLAALVLDGTTVAVGDWLVVQTGLAVSILEEDEARDVLAARREMLAEREET